jgi:Fe-S cluster biosynthesis and repair protein YggX
LKFIYVFNEEVQKELELKGFKNIGKTTINGKEAKIYENIKTEYLSKYTKDQLILMNRLLF